MSLKLSVSLLSASARLAVAQIHQIKVLVAAHLRFRLASFLVCRTQLLRRSPVTTTHRAAAAR